MKIILLLLLIAYIYCGSTDCGVAQKVRALEEEDSILDVETLGNGDDCPEFFFGCLLSCKVYDPVRYGRCDYQNPVQFKDTTSIVTYDRSFVTPASPTDDRFWVYQNDSKAYQSGCLRSRTYNDRLPAFRLLRDFLTKYGIPIPAAPRDSFFENAERRFGKYNSESQYLLSGVSNFFTVLRSFGRMCTLQPVTLQQALTRWTIYFNSIKDNIDFVIKDYQTRNRLSTLTNDDQYQIMLRLEGVERIFMLYYYAANYGLPRTSLFGNFGDRATFIFNLITDDLALQYLSRINELKDETLCLCEDYMVAARAMYVGRSDSYPWPGNPTFRNLVDRRDAAARRICNSKC